MTGNWRQGIGAALLALARATLAEPSVHPTSADSTPPGPACALPFDDGLDPHTTELLDVLKADGVRATFFVLGQQVKARAAARSAPRCPTSSIDSLAELPITTDSIDRCHLDASASAACLGNEERSSRMTTAAKVASVGESAKLGLYGSGLTPWPGRVADVQRETLEYLCDRSGKSIRFAFGLTQCRDPESSAALQREFWDEAWSDWLSACERLWRAGAGQSKSGPQTD
jgi:hypothetical protein